MAEHSPETEKVKQLLKDFGVETEIFIFDQSTKTAIDAANALKCEVAQIAKSIIFKNLSTNQSILVITSGPNRVDTEKLKEIVGSDVKLGDPDFVKEKTGYVVGGVSPVGHLVTPDVYIDADLMKYSEIWAAAGTANSVFKIAPDKLASITKAKTTTVS
jgi:prolyl-tRNA editing enzyme YbaK/EbsC (Cys-tRNA(Pro) deacylase)